MGVFTLKTGSELVCLNWFTLPIRNWFLFVHVLLLTKMMEPFLVVCALLYVKMMLLQCFCVSPSCCHLFDISC